MVAGDTPPSTWMMAWLSRFFDHGFQLSYFFKAFGNKGLPPETGVDAHDQDEIHIVEDPLNGGQGRARVQGHSGFNGIALVVFGFPDELYGTVKVGAGLGMDADKVGPGSGKGRDHQVGGLDHEVDIQLQGAGPAAGLHNDGAVGNIGNELSVHDIDVDPLGIGGLDIFKLLFQPGEVG